MAEYTQTPQRIAITTPLGKDHFLLLHFSGREEMSRLFSYHAYMVRSPENEEGGKIKASEIIGKQVTIENRYLWGEGGKVTGKSYVNGHVRRFVAAGTVARGYREYRAEIVPWLWFLTQKADCRIFQEMTAKEIIETIFGDLSFSDFEWQLERTPETRVYCVQYRETCFNFVSRLLEEEGIGYYFKHEDGKHTLCMTDKTGGYVDCEEKSVEWADDYVADKNRIFRWQRQYEFRTGKFVHTDYDFEETDTKQSGQKILPKTVQTSIAVPDFKKYEIYDYPGLYDNKAKDKVGGKWADKRIAEQEIPHDVVSATSACGSFHPGGKFELKGHPGKGENGKFLVVAIEHEASDETVFASAGGGSPKYTNTFNCIPSDTVFVPARITPRPVVEGVHTAIVTGPAGEEIHTDKHGRIKVQFHWDREGKFDEKTSCWMRVSQYWAGKQWGGFCHPRIGHEVIVDFLEGDPDRPIVTGRVYNGENKFPYDLPANQTKTGILTRSSMKGDKTTFNELRFEDKKGKEEVYIHAERDMNRVVERDDVLVVGWVDLEMGSAGPDDGKNTIDIRGKQTITIHEGDRFEEIKKGKEELFVKEGSRYHEITKSTDSLKVKDTRDVVITHGDHTLQVELGDAKIDADAGHVKITAAQSILLTCGGSTIKLEPAKITIDTVEIKATGSAKFKLNAGGMGEVSAGGPLTVKGLPVKIN